MKDVTGLRYPSGMCMAVVPSQTNNNQVIDGQHSKPSGFGELHISLLFSIGFLTIRAYAEKGHMTINTAISAGCFQYTVKTFKQSMLHLDLTAAISANDVMVVISRESHTLNVPLNE